MEAYDEIDDSDEAPQTLKGKTEKIIDEQSLSDPQQKTK